MSFDEDNRIQAVADQGRTTDFRYDDDTTRVIKRGPGGEVIYVNQWYVDNAGRNSKHVFAGETRLVTKLEMPPKSQPPSQQPPGPGTGTREKFFYFYHPDHLGSTSYVTDQSGEVYQHLEYFPFGETWVDESPGNSTDRVPYRFTGKEFDEETQLYYFGARYYDPRTSLWTAMAPILGTYLGGSPAEGVFEPKNLNLSGYAYQNPIRLTDTDGRCVGPPALACIGLAALYYFSWIEPAQTPTTPDDIAPGLTGTDYLMSMTGPAGKGAGFGVAWGARVVGSKGDEFVTFYHGTTKARAAKIRQEGIDLSRSRTDLDHGPGFYTTTSRKEAGDTAKWKTRFEGGGEPEILEFRVPVKDLEKLRGLDLGSKSPSSRARFFRYFRGDGARTRMHSNDVVSGPRLKNVDDFKAGLPAKEGGQQSSFHTEGAVQTLRKGLQP